MLIPAVTLPLGEREIDTAISRLGYINDVMLLDSVGVDAAEAKKFKPFLRACPCRVGPYHFPFAPDSDKTDAIVSWLDAGARRAVIQLEPTTNDSCNSLAELCAQLPASRHRLVASINLKDLVSDDEHVLAGRVASLMDALRPLVGCVQFDLRSFVGSLEEVAACLKGLRGREGSQDYVDLVLTDSTSSSGALRWSAEEIGQLHLSHSIDVLCPGFLEVEGSREGAGGSSVMAVDAVSAFICCLRTDRPDGLFTTVVCDARGVALGLGLLGIDLDCDSDAVRMTVDQHGSPPAFCHLNRRSCWGGDTGMGHLQRTLEQRKAEAPAGSYTKRLFEDPVLLRNKLVEEAQELAEAETKHHVAEEAADVTYFMMVRCAAAGVGIADVEQELNMRSLKLKRRPGNAKVERIEAGDQILGEGRKTGVSAV